jgi:hypothetical protein
MALNAMSISEFTARMDERKSSIADGFGRGVGGDKLGDGGTWGDEMCGGLAGETGDSTGGLGEAWGEGLAVGGVLLEVDPAYAELYNSAASASFRARL